MDARAALRMKVWGDLACFTRPEFKTERVSYPVPTPSAARGILEAVLWKPAIRWEVGRILVLNPIRFVSFRRNEVNSVIPTGRGLAPPPYFAEDDRAQRNTVALRDVAYVIEATFRMTEKAGRDEHPPKFEDMFFRRLEKGQCFQRPYLGCREFAADFGTPGPEDRPIPDSRPLGLMLHDIEYDNPVRPRFFEAKLEDGVLRVPTFPAREDRP